MIERCSVLTNGTLEKNELFYLYTNIAISCDYSYFWGFFFSLKKNTLSVYDRMLQIGTGLRQELGKV